MPVLFTGIGQKRLAGQVAYGRIARSGAAQLWCEAVSGLASGPPAEPAASSIYARRHAGCRRLNVSLRVLGGSRRAASFLAREARCSLHQGR